MLHSSRSRLFVFCKALCCPSIPPLLLDLRLLEISVEGVRDRRGPQDRCGIDDEEEGCWSAEVEMQMRACGRDESP